MLSAAWRCIRTYPRDGISLLNDRCTWCGWLTGRLSVGIDLCYECNHNSICSECIYEVPGHGLRCFVCDPVLPFHPACMVPMARLHDHVGEAQDAFLRMGHYHPRGIFGRGFYRPLLRSVWNGWKVSTERLGRKLIVSTRSGS